MPAVTGGGMVGVLKLMPSTSDTIGSWRGNISLGGSKGG